MVFLSDFDQVMFLMGFPSDEAVQLQIQGSVLRMQELKDISPMASVMLNAIVNAATLDGAIKLQGWDTLDYEEQVVPYADRFSVKLERRFTGSWRIVEPAGELEDMHRIEQRESVIEVVMEEHYQRPGGVTFVTLVEQMAIDDSEGRIYEKVEPAGLWFEPLK